MLQLSEIWIYPVKSLGGIKLQEAQVTDRGLEHDPPLARASRSCPLSKSIQIYL
ncbi:MOSC N-terminal beta barrel domain-containing protein [Flavobacterium gawalongense]|uniref:Molybdenum cofactor sulfurase middle domain-containing protein n=1 Tax=Flavobacterium gawalongense TaxID=2594432 RepID=A0A553BXG4_9FLAO|nr:hypothetical protein FNW33_01935 [Flavobacterium gawalongense]TRX09288.1 hypothetical protein FNW12_02335 [Flavobacterium gawalongense]TRX12899.1 hypothetical protein FNW11_02445 [Flavobacterium gawalongense]TRX13243.1 hypothetical protein FNW10_02440 [Flavobacterium gawalongense]TRX30695.1 hypothetical protein FNW38_02810 [Flavobacterium gawalongense]